MTPKRDPYPIIENVPKHIVIRARQMVAKRVNPEAKWFYMQGKGDLFTVVQAVIEALMDSERIQSVAHPPRDGQQPGPVRTSSPEPVQAAPFPIPQASSSQATVGNSAMSAVTRVPPPLSADPCLSAQMAMGIS